MKLIFALTLLFFLPFSYYTQKNISYGKEYSDKLTNDFQYATLDINTKKEYNSILFVARKI